MRIPFFFLVVSALETTTLCGYLDGPAGCLPEWVDYHSKRFDKIILFIPQNHETLWDSFDQASNIALLPEFFSVRGLPSIELIPVQMESVKAMASLWCSHLGTSVVVLSTVEFMDSSVRYSEVRTIHKPVEPCLWRDPVNGITNLYYEPTDPLALTQIEQETLNFLLQTSCHLRLVDDTNLKLSRQPSWKMANKNWTDKWYPRIRNLPYSARPDINLQPAFISESNKSIQLIRYEFSSKCVNCTESIAKDQQHSMSHLEPIPKMFSIDSQGRRIPNMKQCSPVEIATEQRLPCPVEFPKLGMCQLFAFQPPNPLGFGGFCTSYLTLDKQMSLTKLIRIPKDQVIFCPGWPETSCCDYSETTVSPKNSAYKKRPIKISSLK